MHLHIILHKNTVVINVSSTILKYNIHGWNNNSSVSQNMQFFLFLSFDTIVTDFHSN